VAAAPGRVNLLGEHTDYNQGLVLPMAIDRCCGVAAAPARTGCSRIFSADFDEELMLDAGRPIVVSGNGGGENAVARGSTMSHVAGVLAGFQRAGYAGGNLDVAIASDVPARAGLSSSAAVEVSVAMVLKAAWRARLEGRELALLCQRAEHEFAGVPCGIMDQFASVLGQRGHALLIDCRSGELRAVVLPPAELLAVVVINSNIRRALAEGEYGKRKATCLAAARVLEVISLRDATLAAVEGAGARLTEEERRCARHVIMENQRTRRAAELLARGDSAGVGQLMGQSHESLRMLYGVSCAELDCLVAAAQGTPGVHGAKMTGAGFGGCVVAVASPAALGELEARVHAAYGRYGQCSVWRVQASAGAAGRTAG
jgi:galactokinase